MKQEIFTIIENKALTNSVYRLRLGGNTSAITRPGQFVNIKLEGKFLRRPISVCDRSGSMLTLIYKTVGKGTEQLSTLTAGTKLDLLTGLGNGYDLEPSGAHPLLIGGGVGIPPLFGLADELLQKGCSVTAILGFNTAAEIFYAEEFRMLGAEVLVTTVDGSEGIKGFVTDAMKDLDYSYFYACGPEPMLKAVYRASAAEGQMSFEKRMGCGFGACMGCTCKTITGYKRICKEGPVLRKEEILWEN
ncbi:MAG: dihydroorotate dehydrogenase electron transfer subunit [Anaerolineaceae bacterium]|nr:dihydroorotate dehydrogenase electron transfer subunit [Anaerolineaceae bacterium]